MIIVGLTGNLASGKSEVAKILKLKGAVIVDADAIARKITSGRSVLAKAILKMFGKDFTDKRGSLDRRKLAAHVFAHPKELKKLNTLVHPGVIVEVYRVIEKHRRTDGLLVLDVPLLFESRMEKLADFTVVVKSSEANMISRASRRGIPSQLARRILAAQWPIMKKARLADFVIDNNSTPEDLKARVEEVRREILELSKQRALEFGQKIKTRR